MEHIEWPDLHGQDSEGIEMRRMMMGTIAAAAVVGSVFVAGGSASAAQPAMCVSVNGGNQVQHGSATCNSVESDGAANVAIAKGIGAAARAGFEVGDSGNRATATGDGSFAVAGSGDGNTATATGNNAIAGAVAGDGNTATATGDDATASVGFGDGNTATATGEGAYAAAGNGDGNTATATGTEAVALAGGGIPVPGLASIGNLNTATATGDTATAFAGSSTGCDAVATGVGALDVCA